MSVQPQPGYPGNQVPGQFGNPGNPYGPNGLPQGVPVRPKKAGSAVLVGLLSCCGLFVVVGIVFAVVAVQNLGNSDLIKNTSILPTVKRDLIEIRNGLESYKQSHAGKYPADLSSAVDSAYLSYRSPTSGQPVKVEYKMPTQEDPDTVAVAGFYVGTLTIPVADSAVEQKTYIRLLKNDTLVQEQITRTPLTTNE